MKKIFFLTSLVICFSCSSPKFINDYSSLKSYDETLISSKIEEMLKDPVLVRFMIKNEKNMTLKEVEKAIKGWKK